MKEIDVLTIGAGGGAYPAAFRFAKAGKDVVMIDSKGVMSGNCLAEGCVPSKALREAADIYRASKKMKLFGLSGKIELDYAKVVKHKDRIQKIRYEQHAEELKEASKHLKLIKGVASFLDEHTVEVETKGGKEEYRAENILIASGADITVPPIKGAEYCITSRDIFALNPALRELPESLTIIGGGYIGLETATIFNALGVKIHIVEMMDRILPATEPRLSEKLHALLDPNIEIVLNARVEEIKKDDDKYEVVYTQHEIEKNVKSDLVLMAIGRKPVVPKGTQEIGVNVEKGKIVVNNALQTNIPHIYAPGDVNGLSMLFHSAVRQSLVAANNVMAGNHPIDYMNFDAVPTTVFTFPEIAYVGIMPSIAKEEHIDLVETDYQFKVDSRAQIFDEMEGEIREFFDVRTMRLVGAWVVGIDADNLIGELGIAVANGLNVKEIAEFANQHPMSSEGISKAARKLL